MGRAHPSTQACGCVLERRYRTYEIVFATVLQRSAGESFFDFKWHPPPTVCTGAAMTGYGTPPGFCCTNPRSLAAHICPTIVQFIFNIFSRSMGYHFALLC